MPDNTPQPTKPIPTPALPPRPAVQDPAPDAHGTTPTLDPTASMERMLAGLDPTPQRAETARMLADAILDIADRRDLVIRPAGQDGGILINEPFRGPSRIDVGDPDYHDKPFDDTSTVRVRVGPEGDATAEGWSWGASKPEVVTMWDPTADPTDTTGAQDADQFAEDILRYGIANGKYPPMRPHAGVDGPTESRMRRWANGITARLHKVASMNEKLGVDPDGAGAGTWVPLNRPDGTVEHVAQEQYARILPDGIQRDRYVTLMNAPIPTDLTSALWNNAEYWQAMAPVALAAGDGAIQLDDDPMPSSFAHETPVAGTGTAPYQTSAPSYPDPWNTTTEGLPDPDPAAAPAAPGSPAADAAPAMA